MNTRCGLCVLTVALAGLAAAPMACQSGGAGGSSDMVSKAMSALPSNIKDSATRYISKYTDLNKMLGGLTNSGQAREALPRLEQTVGSMENDARVLNGAPADVRGNVKTAYGSQLDSLTKGLDHQVSRLMGNKDISSIVKPVLDRVPKLSL